MFLERIAARTVSESCLMRRWKTPKRQILKLDYRIEELQPGQEWLTLHRFDQRNVSRGLRHSKTTEWIGSRATDTDEGEANSLMLDWARQEINE